MKNYFKSLLIFILVLACTLSFAACAFGGEGDGGDEKPNGGDTKPPEGGDENTPPEEPPVETFRIRFAYSYTALVQNSNGRDDYKDEVVTVSTIEVPVNNPVLTAEQIAAIANFRYNGYTFIDWYSEWDKETQTGIDGKIVDFAQLGALDSDITVYGDRGNLAGATATWSVEFFDADGNLIPLADVDSNKSGVTVKEGILTISGTGAMFSFTNADAVDLPWYNYRGKVTQIVVEDGITVIGNNAFSNFTKLKSVSLPETLTDIGASAFAGCSGKAWRTLRTPDSLKTIGNSAFSGTQFKEVVLNEGLVTLGDNAFYGSTAMKSIIVPTSLTSIGIGAFNKSEGTHQLSKVYYLGTAEQYNSMYIAMDNQYFTEFPTTYFFTEDEAVGNTGAYWHFAVDADGVVTTNPVQYCYTVNYFLPSDKLPFASQYVPVSPVTDPVTGDVVTDEDGVAKLEGVITEEILEYRNTLTYHNMKFVGFTAKGSAPKELTVGVAITADISYEVQRGNIVSDGGGLVWAYDSSSGTLSITKNPAAPEGASFEMWDFADAMDTGSLWTGSFNTLNNIKKVVIGDGVEHIGNLAFANLTSIVEIILPVSVKSVAPGAFSGCGALLAVYYMGSDIDDCEGLLDENGNLLLTQTNPSVYQKTEVAMAVPGNYWMELDGGKRICWTITATETVDGDSVTYSNGTLTVGGDSVMVDFEHPEFTPWYGAKDYITSVSFARNITEIGENVLNGFSAVEVLSLPASLRVIPASAFEGTGVVNNTNAYTNGLLVINGMLIKADPSKMSKELVETYNGINIIAGGAFDRCTGIKRLYISSTIQYINAGAFADSDVEVIYFDGSSAGWASVSQDAGFSGDAKVYFNAASKPENDDSTNYWVKVGNEYAILGCNHEFGEWQVLESPTCRKTGKEVRYCIYDSTHVDEREIPISTEHQIDENAFTLYAAATCQSNAIEFSPCILSALGCKGGVYREIEGTKLPHVFPDKSEYQYNGDWTCLTPGTMTGYCTLCETEKDVVEDPDYPAVGEHVYGEWIFNNDSTCLVDGTETHTCENCGLTETREALGSAATTAHKYTKEIEDQKYFAGYLNDGGTLSFFKSCEWCGVKGPYTFEKDLKQLHDISAGSLPSYVAPAKSPSGATETPTAEGAYAAIINGEWFATGKNVSGGEVFTRFNLKAADKTTEVFEFDFKFDGATAVSGQSSQWMGIIKFFNYNNKDETITNRIMNYASEADQKMTWSGMGGAIYNQGEWHTIRLEFVHADGVTTLKTFVDGEAFGNEIKSTKGVVTQFAIHTRGNSYFTSVHFGFKNFSYMAVDEATLSYKNVNCADDAHVMGAYHYDGNGTCTENGTKSAVCLAEGCNYVETVADPEHEAHGHKWSEDPESDGYTLVDATCEAEGYYTRTCIVCGFVDEPLYDKDADGEVDHPKLAHVWADATEENPDGYVLVDATCSAEGYFKRVCTLCETVETVYDKDEDGVNDYPIVEDAHAWADATEENPDGYVKVDATCVANGYHTRTCTICECVETTEDLDADGQVDDPKLGHTWKDATEENVDGYVVVPATCSAEGYYERVCTVCDVVETVYDMNEDGVNDYPVVETAHAWTDATEENPDGYVKVDPTCTEDGYFKRVCSLCQHEEINADLDADGEVDLPKLGHTWADATEENPDGYVIVDATCTEDGYYKRVCSVCDVVETVYDMDEDGVNDIPVAGHVVSEYYYNGDRDCVTDGTETGYCDVCGEAITRLAAGMERLGHLFRPSDFATIPNSATCQHGNETSATCARAGCGEVLATYDENVLTYHSFVDLAEDKYFAGYVDGVYISYFRSCEWCGAKAPYTFTQNLIATDPITDKLPTGMTSATALSDKVISESNPGLSIRIAEERVGDVVNYFIKYKELGSTSQNNMYFTQDLVEGVTTYYYQFDFRWWGAASIRDTNWPLTIKLIGATGEGYNANGELHTGAFGIWTTEGEDSAYFGASNKSERNLKNGDWVTVVYELVRDAEADDTGKYKWTANLYMDGDLVASVKTMYSSAVVPGVKYETRYSSNTGKNNDQEFDFDNVLCYSDAIYALKSENCADGEHSFGWWSYNEDGNCVVNGTHSRVCQNGTCNVIETELDPDHAATGEHNLTGWIYNEDQSCGVVGTLTNSCKDCDFSETVADPDHYPALTHNYGDHVVVPDSANCQHGTKSVAVCANGCGIDDVIYADDKASDHSYIEIADPEFFAGYPDPLTVAYYKTCEWCGEKTTKTFTKARVDAHTFDDGNLAPGMQSSFKLVTEAPATGGWTIVLEEEIAGVVNKYLRNEKVSGDLTPTMKSTATTVDVGDVLIFAFDFRFNYAKNLRSDNYASYFRLRGSNGSYVDNENLTGVAGDPYSAKFFGKTVTAADGFHKVAYVVEKTGADAYSYSVYFDDVKVKGPTAFTSTVIPYIYIENRYTNASGNTDLSYDFDNVVNAIIKSDSVYNTEVCTGDHKFGTYVYHEAATCDKNGTEIAICQNGTCNVTDIRENADLYPATGHTPGDYVVVPESATCQHGTASKATCTVCGADVFTYGDDLGECVFEEIVKPAALSTPADYQNAAVYFKSCKYCGTLSEDTFVYGAALVDKFANGELLDGLNVATFGTAEPVANKNERIVSEQVGDVVNYFLRAQKIDNNGQNFVRLTTDLVEGATEYVFEFKFRWGGTTEQAAQGAMMFKIMKDCSSVYDDNRLSFLGYGNSSSIGAALSINGKVTAAVGEWIDLVYTAKVAEDGKWACTLTSGDTVVFSATVAHTSVPVFMMESRYGAYDMYFDVDDVVSYAK